MEKETREHEAVGRELPRHAAAGGDFALVPLAGARRLALLARMRLEAVGDTLANAAARERDEGALFHLAPIAFGLGAIAYFHAASEPFWPVTLASAAALAAIANRHKAHGVLTYCLIAGALFFAGMVAGQMRTAIALGAAVVKPVSGAIEAVVISADRGRTGQPRYLVRPVKIEGWPQSGSGATLPGMVRLTAARAGSGFFPGDTIVGQARLQPFPGPAYPGGYDFRFFALYDGLGGTGFFTGRPQRGPAGAALPLTARMAVSINRLRAEVGRRIRAVASGDNGEIAVALVTGDRSGISQIAQESLRRSGLAHILSISGVHMALLSLTVIGMLRWTLAWFPAIALHYPVRKWAAAAALAAVTAYLVLSGGETATRRSWLMLAIMLAALLLDRRAISTRNVAIAALVILATTPEAVLEPGFQMSFGATAALVAAFSAFARWREEKARPEKPAPQGMVRAFAGWLGRHGAGLAATSLVAGTASGVIALAHFHRFALWGFAGNLLAMPVVSVAVMPLALLSCLAMPYGLEGPFVAAYVAAIGLVMDISDFVAGFGAGAPAGASPAAFLPLVASGLAILTLLTTRLRLIGVAPIALAMTVAGRSPAPDIAIAEDGRTIAVADAQRKLAPLAPRRNRFVTDLWLNAWSGGVAGNRDEVFGACDKDRCEIFPRGNKPSPKVLLVYDPKLLRAACRDADILLAPRLWFVDCPGRKPRLVLKRGDFERGGAHAIFLAGNAAGETGHVVAVAARGQPSRPWERMFAAAADPPDFSWRRAGPQTRRAPPPATDLEGDQ